MVSNIQLSLDLPKDYESQDGFKEAAQQYEVYKNDKNKQPVFLMYNVVKKQFYVGCHFSKDMIDRYKHLKIVK